MMLIRKAGDNLTRFVMALDALIRSYSGSDIFERRIELNNYSVVIMCKHPRLNSDGMCLQCGADRRGA